MEKIENASRRRLPRGLVAAACVLMLAGAGFATSEWWWEKFTVTEEDLGDGTYHLKVTDDEGNVDFDEVLPNGTDVLHLETGEYVVGEPH
ncbi:MAG: hypothetical protein ACF8XB_23190, partial [Planctomycetota bacterium JB042]